MEPHGPLGSSAKCILGRLDLRRGGRVGRRQPPAKRLQGQNLCPVFESRPLRHAPLAQVDRASDYESEGQRFESSRAHHQNPPRPPGVLGRLLTPPSGAFSSSIEGFARWDRALDIAIPQGPARCLSCDDGDAYEQEHAATLWEICSRGSSARYVQRCLDCTTFRVSHSYRCRYRCRAAWWSP